MFRRLVLRIRVIGAFAGIVLFYTILSGVSRGYSVWTDSDSPSPYTDRNVGNLFCDDETRHVILVTHQRSGSSLLGQLFNMNPDAFYWFEPLDAAYRAMYGTAGGLNVPSDITSYPDGTYRDLPPEEKDYLVEILYNILTCQPGKLPVELFVHHFNSLFYDQQIKMQPFTRCIRHNQGIKYKECEKIIKTLCPSRFNPIDRKTMHCQEKLLKERFWSDNGAFLFNKTNIKKDNFTLFQECINRAQHHSRTCLPLMERQCQQPAASIISTKVVRLPLEVAVALQRRIPKLVIVYNIRHPLAIANSRRRTLNGFSFMSIYAKGNKTKEAQLICQTIYRDLVAFTKLKKEIPQQVVLFSYENYSAKPMEAAMDLYRAMELIPNNKTLQWLHKETKRSTTISSGWRKYVTLEEYIAYRTVCQDLIQDFKDIIAWDEYLTQVFGY